MVLQCQSLIHNCAIILSCQIVCIIIMSFNILAICMVVRWLMVIGRGLRDRVDITWFLMTIDQL